MIPMIDRLFSTSKLKHWVEKIIQKHDRGKISANQLTIIALFFGLFSASLLAISRIFTSTVQILCIVMSFICLVNSLVLDICDGILARTRTPTVFGGILDIFCDRFVEVSIIIALISTDMNHLAWAGIFSLGSIVLCISIFLLMGTINTEPFPEEKKVVYYTRGIMERTETGIFLLIMIAIPIGLVRMILLWIFFALVCITALQRFYIAYILYYPKSSNIMEENNNP